jgi:hypothetical protein
MIDRPLAPYICSATQGYHRFQDSGNGPRCKFCRCWADPAIDYDDPHGPVKRELVKEHPKLHAQRGWK